MRIAVISLPFHSNYGGILQSYALQNVLEAMGHEVTVINKNRYPCYPLKSKIVILLRWVLNSMRNGKFYRLSVPWKDGDNFETINKYTAQFVKNNINTRTVNLLTDILSEEYDCIIIGSDQVWRRSYFASNWGTSITNAFLAFSLGWNIKRISYAASFGVDNLNEYTQEEVQQCARLIKLFNAISVREDGGQRICEKDFGITVTKMPDPTFLLNREDYEKLIPHINYKTADLFYYVLDSTPNIESLINKIEKIFAWRSFHVNARVNDENIPAKQRVQRPVEEWLNAIRSCQAVVTDSFHACVFSIIFNKPFLVVLNKERGACRFTSLLSEFGLEERIVSDAALSDHQKLLLATPPNAKELKVQLREQGLTYLYKALND